MITSATQVGKDNRKITIMEDYLTIEELLLDLVSSGDYLLESE